MPYYIRYKVLKFEPNFTYEAYGSNLSEVFHTSAEALLEHVIIDMRCKATDSYVHKQITYKSDNLNDLLKHFLTAIKDLTEKNIVVKYISINTEYTGYTASLTCRICLPEINTHIKSIDVNIEKTSKQYIAKIVFIK